MKRRLSVNQQEEMIPDDDIKAAFFDRDEIKALPPEEQERRWREALVKINSFRGWLSGIDSYVVG